METKDTARAQAAVSTRAAEQAHTPGPWGLRKMAYGYDLVAQGVSGPGSYGGWFVELHGDDSKEFEASCRLIAAAPELLRLASMIVDANEGLDEAPLVIAARAAIAKAVGDP